MNATPANQTLALNAVVTLAQGVKSSDGSSGLTQAVTVRNSAGDGTTTLTFKNGLLTAVA